MKNCNLDKDLTNEIVFKQREKRYCKWLIILNVIMIVCTIGSIFASEMLKPVFTLGEIVAVLAVILSVLCSSWKRIIN